MKGDASFDGNLACASRYVSFSADVQPIFDAHCTTCHGPPQPNQSLDLTPGVAWGATVGAPSTECASKTFALPALGRKAVTAVAPDKDQSASAYPDTPNVTLYCTATDSVTFGPTKPTDGADDFMVNAPAP